MTRYAVFILDTKNAHYNKAIGYLESLVDQEILTGHVSRGEIWDSNDIERLFPKDQEIKRILLEKNITGDYMVLKVEIINQDELKKSAIRLAERYGSTYDTYELPN